MVFKFWKRFFATDNMDWVKVPMPHDFKAAYFRALCAAMFVMDSGDVKQVKIR
jgi:hypothetical protein